MNIRTITLYMKLINNFNLVKHDYKCRLNFGQTILLQILIRIAPCKSNWKSNIKTPSWKFLFLFHRFLVFNRLQNTFSLPKLSFWRNSDVGWLKTVFISSEIVFLAEFRRRMIKNSFYFIRHNFLAEKDSVIGIKVIFHSVSGVPRSKRQAFHPT